jgi:hypothetical protein
MLWVGHDPSGRWNDGVRNASALHRELQDLGWRGNLKLRNPGYAVTSTDGS